MKPVFSPTHVFSPQTAEDDPRIGHFLGQSPKIRIVLIGFPSDEGVRLNKGRAGAAAAPDAIRQAFFRMTPDARNHEPFCKLLNETHDLGNLVLFGNVSQDQELLGTVVAEWLSKGVFPIILGGGHETAYGQFLGYVKQDRKISILNWDAHPDVRELIYGKGHSGSAFRQAIGHRDICANYTVAGLLAHCVAKSHLDYLHQAKAQVIWKDQLTCERIDTLYQKKEPLMVSFDLDALDQSIAPGVSAPSVGGMGMDLWLHAARRAGESPHVSSVDLVELNPLVDQDGRSCRLAALTIWTFLEGYLRRS